MFELHITLKSEGIHYTYFQGGLVNAYEDRVKYEISVQTSNEYVDGLFYIC
jgi:hypothetical protein